MGKSTWNTGLYDRFLNYLQENTGMDMSDVKRNVSNTDRLEGVGMASSDIQAFLANQISADKQMAFQKEMASTEWQRGVADMQAAGLNPALAYGQGGNSAPAGASADASATVFNGRQTTLNAIQGFMGQIMDLVKVPLEMMETKANIANMYAQNENLRQQNILLGEQTKKTAAEASGVMIDNQTRSERNVNEVKNLEATRNLLEQNFKKAIQETNSEVAKQMLLSAQTAVQHANKEQIEALTPEMVKYQQAATRAQKAAAAANNAKAAIDNKLLDGGFVDAQIEQAQEQARSIKNEADRKEAEAAIEKFKAAVRTGNYLDEQTVKDIWNMSFAEDGPYKVTGQILSGLLSGFSAITEAGVGALFN